jgi:hypothetical protein
MLHYVRFHPRGNTASEFTAAQCLMHRYRCPFWTHDQRATAGACDHCGTPVPIATVNAAELEEARSRDVMRFQRLRGTEPPVMRYRGRAMMAIR